MKLTRETMPGVVRYLTYNLVFPDGDQWIKQEGIAGPLSAWLAKSSLSNEHKSHLLAQGETSWKDNNGVWVILKIEDQPRVRRWGPRLVKGK